MSNLDWSSETVYVTGGAGFIGSHLVDALIQRGARPVVLDDLSRGSTRNLPNQKPITLIDLEKDQPRFVKGAIIFHLAARMGNIAYNDAHQYEMMQRNLALNWNVIEAARKAAPRLLVATSTVCVYPHDAPVPTPESAGDVCNPEPTNHGYGVAKWVLEQQARHLFHEAGIPTVLVRFANAIGLRDYYDEETSHVAAALIRRIHTDDPVVIWGTGRQTRALVDAQDIVECLLRLAETPAAHNAQAINISHDEEISIAALYQLICNLTERWPRHSFDTSRPDGHARRAFDTSRLHNLIGPYSFRRLEETLAGMIADYRARYNLEANR